MNASKPDNPRNVGVFELSKKRFFRSLSIRTKLWLNTAILSVPLLGLGYFYVDSLSSTYFFTKTEAAGLALFQPAARLANDLAMHQAAAAGGEAAGLASSERDAVSDLDALQKADAAGGRPATAALLADLRGKAAAALVVRDGSAAGYAAHQAAIDAATAYKNQVGSDWLLILDPEISAYNLIDVSLMKLPDMQRAMGDARVHLAALAASGRPGGPEAYDLGASLALLRDRLQAAHDELAAASDSAGDRPTLQASVKALGQDWMAPFVAFGDDATAALKSGQPSAGTWRSLQERGTQLAGAAGDLQQRVYAVAGQSLALRGSRQYQGAVFALGGATIAMVVAVWIMIMLARRISGAVVRLLGITMKIAEGQFDAVIDRTGNDEISRLYDGVAAMQQRLLEERERELQANAQIREAATINQRIRQALDSVSTSVMVADAGNTIIFANRQLTNLLSGVQAEIRQRLPAFDVGKIVGSSMDAFHGSPDASRRVVDGLTGPHTVRLVFGGHSFRLTATPVQGDDGKRIGTVVEWLDRTQEEGIEAEVGEMVAAVNQGDLARRIRIEGKTGFFGTLSAGINDLVQNFTDIVVQVKLAAGEVNRGASEISLGNANLSQRTEEQASSLEQTASSMEQMTSTVKQNADNAGQANQLAVAARDQADKGGAVVARAVKAMGGINESSRRIADIIGVIDEIAFQTNLLALNAAVEAARAGEQGRGFAVVASEVRNLAGRSAAAAKEIKELIKDSVQKVEEGSQLVTQSGATLDQIVAAVKKVGDIVAEIAAASGEQSTGIEEVNKAVMQLDELTQQNAALVEQATAASQSMAEQAQGLAELMLRYQVPGDAGVATSRPPVPAPGAATASPPAKKPAARTAALDAASDAAADKAPTRRLAATGTGGGAEWSEF